MIKWVPEERGPVDTTRPSLLLRIRDRSDTHAWRTFDAIYRPMLRRFARARGLSEVDAEDVTQHCMATIYDRIGEFAYDPRKGRFKSWLRTLVNNRVRDSFRTQHERPGDTRAFQRAQQREPAPDEAFEKVWMEEHLGHCLRELRTEVEDKTFRAFWNYVMEQQPIEQVCAEFGLKPNNVYTIKWRMTERIAVKMRELVDGLE
jgi:RNA polymerase sigma factor (sigma-70 family)